MDGKPRKFNVSQKSEPHELLKKGKKFPWKTDYWALITLLKAKYEKYLYHCRIIY